LAGAVTSLEVGIKCSCMYCVYTALESYIVTWIRGDDVGLVLQTSLL